MSLCHLHDAPKIGKIVHIKANIMKYFSSKMSILNFEIFPKIGHSSVVMLINKDRRPCMQTAIANDGCLDRHILLPM